MPKKKSFRITTPSGRRDLKPRREPYWFQLQLGAFVGFRKSGYVGTWIARWRPKGGKQEYRALGDLADYDASMQFNRAAKAASIWFDAKAKPGAPKSRKTVGDAVKYYLECLEAEKTPGSAKEAKWRAKARILPKFEKTFLDEITKAELTRWRNDLVPKGTVGEVKRKARDTANRYLNTFKAVLIRAHDDGLVTDDTAWRKFNRFKKTAGKRTKDGILTSAQVARLLKHSRGGFRDLTKGLLLTGMRPGREIESLLCEQYQVRNGRAEIRIREDESKTGERTVLLSLEGKKFFDNLTKSKTPKAPLFATDDGRPWREKEAADTMREVRRAARLPANTVLYSLRHFYITQMLENGANAKLICDNVGTSLGMLALTYWGSDDDLRQRMLNDVPMLPAGTLAGDQ